MHLTLRYIKAGMVGCIALFFTIVAFGNITDFNSNWLFVKHVLSMDTTFHDPAVMWRAIDNLTAQRCAYYFIILWQMITAVICWIGCFSLFSATKKESRDFNESKKMALIGLFLGFLLYMVGFIIIGGEWFSMWQSAVWNGQMKAGLFVALIMFVMIFVMGK